MTPPFEGDYAHVPGDRRKQLTESSGSTQGTWQPPMPQPEASEAVAAWRDEIAAMVNEMSPAASDDCTLDDMRAFAARILKAGYLSPDQLTSLLTEAWSEGVRVGHREAGDVYRTDDGSHMHSTPNPYRSGGAR